MEMVKNNNINKKLNKVKTGIQNIQVDKTVKPIQNNNNS